MTKEEFWERTKMIGACRVWMGARTSDGYGCLRHNGKAVYAHRFSSELSNGPIPPGIKVLHRCDNPPCVLEAHLFRGTEHDNHLDAIRKGRLAQKLNWCAVRWIRELAESTNLSQRTLAEMFHVHQGLIWQILHNRTWKDA